MQQLIHHVDRVEADVECVLCGRLVGQLFGVIARDTSGRRVAPTLENLTTFRAAVPDAPSCNITGHERFRCQHCGGVGMAGEVIVSVLPDQLPAELCPIHGVAQPGRGRPPRGCACYPNRSAA